jgi:H+/gluconate symporter-like permease
MGRSTDVAVGIMIAAMLMAIWGAFIKWWRLRRKEKRKAKYEKEKAKQDQKPVVVSEPVVQVIPKRRDYTYHDGERVWVDEQGDEYL